jgi:hypothetical protein
VTITSSAAVSPKIVSFTGTGIVGDTGLSLVVTPQASCILPSGTQQFAAQVRNTSNTAVTWFVNGVQGGNRAAGTISTQGLYSAPPWAAGKLVVQAVSQADASIKATTTINVTATPSLGLFPSASSIPISGQLTFEEQICGVPDSNVTWSVDNIAGGNAPAGTITSDGVYTAPNVPGQHTIQATDTVQNKTSVSAVVVYSGINVDFGARTNTRYPIRPGILGMNHVDWLRDLAGIKLVSEAGVTLSRTYAYMYTIYATQTPDWSQIDPAIASLESNGMQVLLEVAYTPVWLQASPNPCGISGDFQAPPADVNMWAQMAAALVAHLDAKFPGVVTDYEIWNEPDGGGMCGPSTMNAYLAIYAAAAPAMKQQAAADGAAIRVGGPAVAEVDAAWIAALLSNPSTAPYVDFVSYHDYIEGRAGVDAAWDSFNGNVPLYQATQQSNPTTYLSAFQLVSAGTQPGGAITPIYIDEYNTNWTAIQDCCRNDPTYAPVWNALYVSDLLDVVYAGQAQLPAQLTYFAANEQPYFCLIGDWDANMDCQYSVGTAPVPYPQYYAYLLMASPQYLGMNSGGYMAASVSPTAGSGGPVSTAFYTSNQDSILIVNPTSTNYTEIAVTAQNVGFSSPLATLYQIVNGQSIAASNLTLTPSGAAYTATISLPPYSVMGISIVGP